MEKIKAKLELILEFIKTFDNRINQLETSTKLMNSRLVEIAKTSVFAVIKLKRSLMLKLT